jgi:acetolactate synthase-1/2/3 large subunit
MNGMSGAEAFVRMLQLFGVRHIFRLCEDTSLPFYDALYQLDHGITHILTRNERSAAYMADGYSRVSGRVGVCEGPSGGGATYILPGVGPGRRMGGMRGAQGRASPSWRRAS